MNLSTSQNPMKKKLLANEILLEIPKVCLYYIILQVFGLIATTKEPKLWHVMEMLSLNANWKMRKLVAEAFKYISLNSTPLEFKNKIYPEVIDLTDQKLKELLKDEEPLVCLSALKTLIFILDSNIFEQADIEKE
jgi:hypothetical protein